MLTDQRPRKRTIKTRKTQTPRRPQAKSANKTSIVLPAGVEISEGTSIASTARFDIGKSGRVILAPHAQVRDGAHFEVYDEGVVTIGARAVIGVNNWMQGNGDITIGDDTILGPGVVITSTDHQMDLALPIQQQPLSKRPVVIGRDVWIGANASIVAGVTIGDHAVIGANSLVNRNVPPAAIVGGCPARKIGERTTQQPHCKILFAIALGINDRPERWEAVTRFFVTLGNTLREAGVDCWYVCHTAAASPLVRIRRDRKIMQENHEGFDAILERVQPDHIFIWNGASDGDVITRQFADRVSIPCRFGELGWFPQSKMLYFDTDGTNARSSIRKIDLTKLAVDPRLDEWLIKWRGQLDLSPPDRRDYIFVPLQDERDLNITLASPYSTMFAFVEALAAKFPSEHFIVRPHPQFADVRLPKRKNIEIRLDGPLHGWLTHADAVIGINSTVLLESLALGMPTHSLGEGITTGLNVMYELGDVSAMTIHRSIDAPRADRTRRLVSELIFVRQTQRKDLHYLDRLNRAHGISDLLKPAFVTAKT